MFILMSIWIVWKDLMKHHYHLKNIFYSDLNLENICDKDYLHPRKIWGVFEIRNLGE